MNKELSPDEADQLRVKLEVLQRRQQVITNKETLRELQYEAAEIRWRLGLMTDEEFEELEEFHDSFSFEF